MKLSCTKENLSRALSITSGVTGKNVNLPILNNVLIRADEQKMEVVATNLEIAVIINVRAKIEKTGSFTVPARTLADYVNLANVEKIDLEVKDNDLLVSCGKSSTKIKGISSEDYPIIPAMEDGKGFVIKANTLRTGLNQVLPAVAKNDIRPELAGVFFGFNINNQELVLASTDSYRLAEKKMPILQGGDQFKIIVPGRTASEITKILNLVDEDNKEEGARIMVNDNQIMVSYGRAQVLSKLTEGSYPDYTQIIPKNFNTTVEIDTNNFVKEMKSSGLFTTTGVNAVTLAFDPTAQNVKVSSMSTQTGEYQSEMPCEVKGAANNVLLNNHYILDGLNNCGTNEVMLKIISGDSPCILSPKGDDSYIYIIMPIRQ